MFRFLLLLFCLGLAVIDGRYFRNDYTFHNETGGWMKLHRIPSNWNEARLRCHLEGATLASPLDDNLSKTMKSVIHQWKLSCGVYTGISASYSRGDFYSIEGLVLTQRMNDQSLAKPLGVPLDKIPATWAPEEPNNNKDKEQCIIYLAKGTVADVDCLDTYPYICYKKNSEDMPTPLKCGTVDPNYSYSDVTSHCYKFHTVGQIWSRAFMTCAAEGGHLAIINSDKEAQVLRELFAKFPSKNIMAEFKDVALIGFRAEKDTNDWMTIHGQTLKEAGYEFWANGEPNNATIQSCGAMFRDARLDDFWCNKHAPFICEKTQGIRLDNASGTTDEATVQSEIAIAGSSIQQSSWISSLAASILPCWIQGC